MMLETHPLYYEGNKFFVTSKGNKISRQVLIKGSDRILIDGKTIILTGCVLRGDLAQISMGYFCVVREECIIRPCYTKTQGRLKYSKMSIGDNVFIDKDTIICALKIGNNVQIGKSCIIG
jgi:dynactin-5